MRVPKRLIDYSIAEQSQPKHYYQAVKSVMQVNGCNGRRDEILIRKLYRVFHRPIRSKTRYYKKVG